MTEFARSDAASPLAHLKRWISHWVAVLSPVCLAERDYHGAAPVEWKAYLAGGALTIMLDVKFPYSRPNQFAQALTHDIA